MRGPGSEAERSQAGVVVERAAHPGALASTGLVVIALAARGFEAGAGALHRGIAGVAPARRVLASVGEHVGEHLSRPTRLAVLEAEGAHLAEVARVEADRRLTAALGVVADQALARLDVAALVRARVDVDAIVADAIQHADLDAAAARLDVDAVVDRLDLTRIVIERVDLRAVALALLERLDLTGIVLDGVDLGSVVAAAIDRTDLDALTATVIEHADLDLTRIVIERVDLDAVLEAVLSHLDLVALAGEVIDGVDLPEIIRESTGSMASDTVRSARMQGIRADEAVEHAVDRLLLRRRLGRAGAVGGPAGGPAPS